MTQFSDSRREPYRRPSYAHAPGLHNRLLRLVLIALTTNY